MIQLILVYVSVSVRVAVVKEPVPERLMVGPVISVKAKSLICANVMVKLVSCCMVMVKSWKKLVPTAVPLVIVALTVMVPALVAIRLLPPLMLAPVPPAFWMLQIMVLWVASVGATVAVRGYGGPTSNVSDESRVMPVTGVKPTVKLTLMVSLMP